MATRFLDDNEIENTNIDPSCTVKWQAFAVNLESSLEKICDGTGPALPLLREIIESTRDNKDIFITFNQTLKGLNKAIIIQWGDQTSSNEDYVQITSGIPQLASIEVESETDDYIILHPKSQQQLIEIHSELTCNQDYIGIIPIPNMQMLDKVRSYSSRIFKKSISFNLL